MEYYLLSSAPSGELVRGIVWFRSLPSSSPIFFLSKPMPHLARSRKKNDPCTAPSTIPTSHGLSSPPTPGSQARAPRATSPSRSECAAAAAMLHHDGFFSPASLDMVRSHRPFLFLHWVPSVPSDRGPVHPSFSPPASLVVPYPSVSWPQPSPPHHDSPTGGSHPLPIR
jgi:hypothetical protein